MGVALGGVSAGAVGLMQYGTVGGYNALSFGSQGKNLITIYGNNSVVELANVADGKVGIGTSTPGFPLNFPNTIGDKISLFGNSGNHYGFGIQGSLLQIHTSAIGEDIAFGYGSSSTLTEIMRIKGNGRVGIGVNDPQQFLSIKSGMNIDQTNLNHGSLDNNVLRFGSFSGEAIGSARATGDNVWGLDFYTNSMKRMAISNSGNVGIGVNDPGFKLDISGRMKIRTGTDGEAGIWLNNTANTNIAAFIGLENDNYVGFYGVAAGWKFVMNTQTGALKVGTSEGQAGQVLTSNGTSAAMWASSTNSLYNNTNVFNATGQIVNGTSAGTTEIPGLTNTFTLSANAKVIVSWNVYAVAIGCFGCGGSSAYLDLFLDGGIVASFKNTIGNGETHTFSASYLMQLGSGTHTIKIAGDGIGPDVQFGGSSFVSYMILQRIPE
jgi:hypothetical protein